MSFHDIELDRAYSYGSVIAQGGNTSVIELESGAEERNERWGDTRIVANLAFAIKEPETELAPLLDFKRCRGHRAHSFRFWNPLDYSTNSANTIADDDADLVSETDELIGTGDASTTQFQLVKTYTSGITTKTRNIKLPIAGTVKVAIDGVEQLSGWSVNTSTGIVTFTVAPSNGAAVTAGCQFNEEVRFESDEDAISIESFSNGQIPGGLRIVSVFDSRRVDDEFVYRGSSHIDLSADTELTTAHGALVSITPSTSGLQLILPDIAAYQEGGPHWKLSNLSATDTFDVVYGGVTLWTMATAGDAAHEDQAEIWLGDDGGGSATWIAFHG